MAKTLKDEYFRLGNRFTKQRSRLQDGLNEVMNRQEFAEDYYRKPLEAMQRLLDDPQGVWAAQRQAVPEGQARAGKRAAGDGAVPS